MPDILVITNTIINKNIYGLNRLSYVSYFANWATFPEAH